MKLLLVHQNMPGQYRELVQFLAIQGGHSIFFLTQRNPPPKIPGVTSVIYKPQHKPKESAYGLSKVWEEAAGTGFGAAMAARRLEREAGFKPDLIVGHTGWGELLFFKQIWPDVPILGFFEYFYLHEGALVGFDPDDPPSEHSPFLLHARNAVPFANLQVVDFGHVPTEWQKNLFPKSFHSKFYTCHDGIRTDQLMPNAGVRLSLSRLGKPLTRDDEVFTYLARNLEHSRGFHIFMRALPKILRERPNARAIVLGGNEVSYGRKTDHPKGLRGEMEEEVGTEIDWSRVHFLGHVAYSHYREIVQISKCHIYLTMPFVLSWSLLEAMSMQATIISSDVAPVREVMTDGETGMLVNFFDHEALADRAIRMLADPAAHAHLGQAARALVVEKYDFLTRCLPEHLRRMNDLVPKAAQIPFPKS